MKVKQSKDKKKAKKEEDELEEEESYEEEEEQEDEEEEQSDSEKDEEFNDYLDEENDEDNEDNEENEENEENEDNEDENEQESDEEESGFLLSDLDDKPDEIKTNQKKELKQEQKIINLLQKMNEKNQKINDQQTEIIQITTKEQLQEHFLHTNMSIHELIKIFQQGQSSQQLQNINIIRQNEGLVQRKMYIIPVLLFSNLYLFLEQEIFDYKKINQDGDLIDQIKNIYQKEQQQQIDQFLSLVQ